MVKQKAAAPVAPTLTAHWASRNQHMQVSLTKPVFTISSSALPMLFVSTGPKRCIMVPFSFHTHDVFTLEPEDNHAWIVPALKIAVPEPEHIRKVVVVKRHEGSTHIVRNGSRGISSHLHLAISRFRQAYIASRMLYAPKWDTQRFSLFSDVLCAVEGIGHRSL